MSSQDPADFPVSQTSTLHVYVIVPTLNEGESVGEVIQRLNRSLEKFEYEIVVVDGYSVDGTRTIAERLGATVLMEKAHGYGGAYLTGFDYVLQKRENSIVVMIDADLTYYPEDIPALIEPILEGEADIVLANRFAGMEGDAMSFRNRIGNKIISRIISRLFGLRIHDSQSGFRAISGNCLRRMFLEVSGMPLATEILIEARKIGAKIVEVPGRYARRVGKSKIRPWRDSYGILWTSIRLVSEFNPFIVYGGLALFFFTLGTGFGIYAFTGWYQWYFYGSNTWPRLGSALLSVLFLVAATIVFVLGILLDTLLHRLRAGEYWKTRMSW